MDRSRFPRFALAALLVPLLGSVFFSQRALNESRVELGVTRGEVLGKTAPPVLVFTTVALGGFRGLIANALWVRAMELQEQDKYFEKVQLTDWITKLQPHFVTVWVVQAWDMAYNISVKFPEARDRWLWVQRGIELLRDEGLKYNPDEPLIYRELAWFFQHKLGQDLDDAHFYYKSAWAKEMAEVLAGTNYVALINPQTPDEKARALRLRGKYKLDPRHMQEVDGEYGPLEWRLPESHAIYWATLGLQRAKKKDLITLRRAIYQPMQMAFQRGRLVEIDTPESKGYQFGPNLAMIPRANKAYEKMMAEDAEYRDHISTGHRNFLKDAVQFLYMHNRRAEAEQWFRYLLEKYPQAYVNDVRREDMLNVLISSLSLDDYVVVRVTEAAGETSNVRTRAVLEGLLVSSFYNFAIGQDDQGLGYDLLAQKVWARFQSKVTSQTVRVGLPPYGELKQQALRVFEQTYGPTLSARLRSKLGLPVETAAPPARVESPAPATP
jgi:hypothetical protein